jgi:hypothetical protein
MFWDQVIHGGGACKFVALSRCTVFIQNSLLVDWLGLAVTVVFVADTANAADAAVVPLLLL